MRSLIDEGAVVKKGDTFEVTDKINTVTVPLTINEVLMSRIDRLDEETKNLIKTASVIGRYFFYKIIAQVAENISDIDKRLSLSRGHPAHPRAEADGRARVSLQARARPGGGIRVASHPEEEKSST